MKKMKSGTLDASYNVDVEKNEKSSFINNLKVRSKMFLISGTLIALTIFLSMIAIFSYIKIYNETYAIGNDDGLAFDYSTKFYDDFMNARIEVYKMLYFGSIGEEKQRDEAINKSKEYLKRVEEEGRQYIQYAYTIYEPNSPEYEGVKLIEENLFKYLDLLEVLDDAVLNNSYAEVSQIIEKKSNIINDMFKGVEQARGLSTELLVDDIKAINRTIKSDITILLTTTLIILVTGILLTLWVSKKISSSIDKLTKNIEYLKTGDTKKIQGSNDRDEVGAVIRDIEEVSEILSEISEEIVNANNKYIDGQMCPYIESDKYLGAYSELTDVVNNIFTSIAKNSEGVLDGLTSIAEGNFDFEVTDLPGELGHISGALKDTINSIINVESKIKELEQNANNGIIKKVDTAGTKNSWLELVEGLNDFIVSVETPIKEVNNVLSDMSEGNLSTKITGEYRGVFDDMKQNVNSSVDSVNLAINETKVSLSEIVKGNLDFELEREAKGDFNEIQKSIKGILKMLNSVLKEFKTSCIELDEIANDLTETSAKIANGSVEQAASIQEVNASVEIINENTLNNAKKSIEANELANKTRDNALRGDDEMKTMLSSMEDIKEASYNIANIIKVIDDIAFQTNLLALNAAVEAARAGQHGKGFAVVAEEVRTLAGRSKEAASNTAKLINESLEKVELGNKLANSTASALNEIVNNVSEVSILLDEISTVSTEQAQSISGIVTNLNTFEDVVQNNTNEAEECARTSQTLVENSGILTTYVENFNLSES